MGSVPPPPASPLIFHLYLLPHFCPSKPPPHPLIIMIPPGRLDGMEARGADERDSTIYDPVSRDCLARVWGGGASAPTHNGF